MIRQKLAAVEQGPVQVFVGLLLGGAAAALLGAQPYQPTWESVDRRPTPENAERVTGLMHQVVMVLLGSAAIAAVRVFQVFPASSDL